MMDGATVAQFGQIHPDVAAARKLRQDVFIAEIYLDRLYQHDLRQVRYEALPRFPAVERDFSFVFDDAVEFDKIQQTIAALAIRRIAQFRSGRNFPRRKSRRGQIFDFDAGEISIERAHAARR